MKKTLLTLLVLLIAIPIFSQTIDKKIFDQIIDSRFKPDEPGGTAIIAQHGKIIYEHAFGMASLELNVKMQPDMVFCTGSMTKQFTAICILQLMEQGKLKVTDPISNYIADCPESWKPITIENLLSHTSGIADQPVQGNTSENWVKLYQSKPLSFQPGTKYFYANSEYVILGYIIEHVSGMAYANYLKANILTPAGMTHTYIQDDRTIISNRVPAYLGGKNGFRNVLPSGLPGTAAGTLLSTTHDMLLWNQALVAGKLVKKETLDKAWTSFKLNSGKAINYGYGWQTGGSIQGSPIVEHGGVAVGYITDAIYMLKEDIYVAVFVNQRSALPDFITDELAANFIGKPYSVHPVNLSDDSLKTFTGNYADSAGVRTIVLTNHKLFYQHGNGPKLPLTPCGADRFYFDNTQVTGEIGRDAARHILGLVLIDRRYPDQRTDMMKKTDRAAD
jgi:CubicO group peptidase (beta-lactamase class C family)